jgi:type VI secretion system protein ImpJ
VPRARSGVTEVDFGDGSGDGNARYGVADLVLRDQVNAADEPEPVQLGAPRLQLLRQRDAGDAYAVLGVVRVLERRADAQLVLDRGYLAPQTRIEASGPPRRCATAWSSSEPARSRRRWGSSARGFRRSRTS